MKWKFVCILSIVSVIFGCTKSQIKDSLRANFRANRYTAVTVFPVNPEDDEFAECVQKRLKEKLHYLKFISGENFRKALFPWFEPNTAPDDIRKISVLLSNTLVRKRIETLGVELLIYVHGRSKSYDENFGGFPYVGALYTAKRETHIWTTLWDLKKIDRVGDTDISYKGTVVAGIIAVFPVVSPVFSKTNACSETARRISNCLTGKVSSTGK